MEVFILHRPNSDRHHALRIGNFEYVMIALKTSNNRVQSMVVTTINRTNLFFFCCCFLFQVVACSTPTERIAKEAAWLGLQPMVLVGKPFAHRAYHVPGSGPLHIYLEGDGRPWMNHRNISPDPTPHNPLMLRLMKPDTAPKLYLGRPCYFGIKEHSACTPRLWTEARYSSQVVDSMEVALRNYLAKHSHTCLRFFGHSGGGTLAMLLAARFSQAQLVVTLAGNLDVAAWSALHGYTPLTTSLDPAKLAPLPVAIRQLHLAGDQDKNIPSTMLRRSVARQPLARFRLIKEADHACCWSKLWPGLLLEFQSLDSTCFL